MRKKIILLIFFVLGFNSAFSQISKVYTYDTISNKVDCNIFFYKEGVYEVTLEDYTDENPYLIILSFGQYTIQDDKIVLFDKYNEFKMQFVLKDSFIVGHKTYKWLKDKKMQKSYFEIYDKPFFQKANFKNLAESRSQFAKQNINQNDFYLGTYKMQMDYILNFNSCASYQFKYKEIIISEGTWKRKGNELILKDIEIETPFYILIGKETLINKMLPGDFNIEMTKVE